MTATCATTRTDSASCATCGRATAARDLMMAELGTKSHLQAMKQELQNSIESVGHSIDRLIEGVRMRLEILELRLTLRFGTMMVVAKRKVRRSSSISRRIST